MSEIIETSVCAAPGCDSIMDGSIAFLRLPVDQTKFTNWLDKLPIDAKSVRPGDWLCFSHFADINEQVHQKERQKEIALKKKRHASMEAYNRERRKRLLRIKSLAMKPALCSAPSCSLTEETIEMFRFPKDKNLADKWFEAIRHSGQMVKYGMRICKRHFRIDPAEDWTAVPELLLTEESEKEEVAMITKESELQKGEYENLTELEELKNNNSEVKDYTCKSCRAIIKKQKNLQNRYDQKIPQYAENLRIIEELKYERNKIRQEYQNLMIRREV